MTYGRTQYGTIISFGRIGLGVSSNTANLPYGVDKIAANILHGDRDSGGFRLFSLALKHTRFTA